jgi:L-threonylcarbamoyladenylate synthase
VGAPRIVMLPDEPEGYARRLYAALHELDAAGAAAIVVEAVPETAAWDAIRDRLRRAATP